MYIHIHLHLYTSVGPHRWSDGGNCQRIGEFVFVLLLGAMFSAVAAAALLLWRAVKGRLIFLCCVFPAGALTLVLAAAVCVAGCSCLLLMRAVKGTLIVLYRLTLLCLFPAVHADC